MSVARSYAKALYQAEMESKSADAIQLENQFDAIVTAVDSSKDLQFVLFGPVVTKKEKGQIITELAKRLGLSQIITNFLILLANKGRLPLLHKIREEFGNVRLISEGGIPGRLVAAEAMDKADIENLARAFTQRLGKKVSFQVSTDPSLLAGMKVTVNGVTYDGTLRSQLQRLRDRFVVGMASGN